MSHGCDASWQLTRIETLIQDSINAPVHVALIKLKKTLIHMENMDLQYIETSITSPTTSPDLITISPHDTATSTASLPPRRSSLLDYAFHVTHGSSGSTSHLIHRLIPL